MHLYQVVEKLRCSITGLWRFGNKIILIANLGLYRKIWASHKKVNLSDDLAYKTLDSPQLAVPTMTYTRWKRSKEELSGG